jgi:hypothetical protein
MKAPTAAAAASGFAKPSSPTTNDSDSEGPSPPPEAFEELSPEPEESPVEEVPSGPRLSPLLSRSAFAECLMCYAVEEEMGSSVSHQCLYALSYSLCYSSLFVLRPVLCVTTHHF